MTVYLHLSNVFIRSLLQEYLHRSGYKTESISNLNSINGVNQFIITDLDRLNQLDTRPDNHKIIWFANYSQGYDFLYSLPQFIHGVLGPGSTVDELLPCIKLIEAGQSYISSQLLRNQSLSPDFSIKKQLAQLSKRERQVFELMKQGLTTSKIADQLFISTHTAENHRANIQKKLSLTGRLSLCRFAASVHNT